MDGMKSVVPASLEGGGGVVVSYGSGDSGGRLNRAAAGRGSTRTASSARVRAVRSEINRSGLSQRRRRQLLQEIDDNRNARGNIRTGVLRDILADFRDLL